MPSILCEKDCGPKCKSRKHVWEIISLITRGSLKEFQAYSLLCHNWQKHSDIFGRSALHVAASCGKVDILEWLLEEMKMDVSARDLESGYTAMHRALFYGQLACARLLSQFNCDLQIRDVEGLNPLDLVMMDRASRVTFSLKEPNEVYSWGDNSNNTLGHAGTHKRSSPEVIDTFRQLGVSIKQIVLCKYHSTFLTQSGLVYTCGHGQGGRLGHAEQHTLLVPKVLESVKEMSCVEIAASTDHTLLRMEGGCVLSFGVNQHHQLGQTPILECCPEPRQMNLKTLKGRCVSGVCVGRFHSVVYTSDSVYTVGLNAGQLGHSKGEKYCSQLKQVTSLRHTDIGIAKVACSDAASVCLTTKGDVYVLHEYQCRKIASKWQEVEQVLVSGGYLDHSASLDVLREQGGQELHIFMRNDDGQLFLWRSGSPTFKRCQYVLRRQLRLADIAVTSSNLIICTDKGETFMGYISNRRASTSTHKEASKVYGKDHSTHFRQTRVLDLLLKDEAEEVQVRRLPVLHRSVLVAADKKGRDFAVVQTLPNGCMSEFPCVTSSEMLKQFGQLFKEAETTDSIHDAVLKVGERRWAVHRYIVSMRSDYLRNFLPVTQQAVEGDATELNVHGLSPELMEQILQFMYTDTCEYLQIGHKISHSLMENEHTARSKQAGAHEEDTWSENFNPPAGMSAFQVQQQRNKLTGEAGKGQGEKREKEVLSQNPVKRLQDLARKLGVKGLAKRLDAVKCSSDVIQSQGRNMAKPKLKLDRRKLPELCDITLCAEDGKEVACHKCVLVARLEYFYSMLATGWVESFSSSSLTLPVVGDVLEILVDYLYQDEAPQLRDCSDEDLLCKVLIVSDQLLAWRLKEMCEVALTDILSFKNASDLLEMSTLYNADQLKVACQQFISLNLEPMFEGRYLDVLSRATLEELTLYYRATIPTMSVRVLSPSDQGPSQAYLNQLVENFEHLDWDKKSHSVPDTGLKKGKMQKKRPKARNKSITEEMEKSQQGGLMSPRMAGNLSVVCDMSVKSEDDIMSVVEKVNQQVEQDEKRNEVAAAARNKEKKKWHPLEIGPSGDLQGMAKQLVPTQPEKIPVWNSRLKTLSWAATRAGSAGSTQSDEQTEESATSPVSPPVLAASPTSLRDIMKEETSEAERKRSSFFRGISWKDVKKQQNRSHLEKQQSRSRVSLELGEESRSHVSLELGEEGPSHKPAANPWASVESTVKSFRDLMLQDQSAAVVDSQSVSGQLSGSGHPSRIACRGHKSSLTVSTSWGLSKQSARNTVIHSPSSPVPTCPTGADNPWQRRASLTSSPQYQATQPAPDFSAIVQDEMDKTETLVKAQQKPLALIQLEEQAMTELLQHYKASQRTEDFVTVERVSKVMAQPLWHRDRTPSGPAV